MRSLRSVEAGQGGRESITFNYDVLFLLVGWGCFICWGIKREREGGEA